MQSISTHGKRPRSNRPTRTLSTAHMHKRPDRTIQLANKSKPDYTPKPRTTQKEVAMPTQKKVIISTRKNLIEATVYNRSEVVKYLERNNWHLDRENFVCVAPGEYCLVNKSALTPDMDIVFEGVVHAWSTAETVELKELREYKSQGTKARSLLAIDIAVLCMAFMATVFLAWSHIDTQGRVLICATGLASLGIRICILNALNDQKSNK